MSKEIHERTIFTEGTFKVTNHAGEQVEVCRELMICENADAEWLIAVTEPNQDDPEGDVLRADTIVVPDEAAGVFDDLFTRIADPSRLGARTR